MNISDREIEAGLEENIRLGYIERAGVDADGEPTYRLTDAGKARVESMPDHAEEDARG